MQSGNYCLRNTRNINIANKCNNSSQEISYNKQDEMNGYIMTAKTLNFKNREKKSIRLTNTYTFGTTKIICIWSNIIRLLETPIDDNTMKMMPHLSQIWLNANNININGAIPYDMITKMVHDINKIINKKIITIKQIDLDQFEMLKNNGIYISPDLIFEKLLIYADTINIASQERILYKREIPDNIELLVSIEEEIDTHIHTYTDKRPKLKYIDF
jgi:hypothetical protein